MTSTSSRQAAPKGSVPTVGGYRLLNRIGEGGMGVVHLAQGPDGRRAALKVLRPNVIGDDESRRRLAQEVESLQHVRSSNVAEILDADPWGEVPYVVTRFVPGHSLHAMVEHKGPLSGPDLEHAARGLLRAVHDVHDAHVLHRDIKPTNVVMEGRSPILIDFGLARLAEDPRLTATGWLMGTPGYLAPEVLFGSEATVATDVHGWACTLVYAATGQSPYGRGHVMTVLDRTRRGEVDLAGVPDRLRPLLAAALAPEPHQRPTVAEAMATLDELDGSEALAPTVPWSAAAPSRPRTRQVTATPPVQPAPHTRPYTVVAPAGPPQQAAPTPYQRPVPMMQPHDRLTGWARFRRSLVLLAVLALVVVAFGTAPYVTAALVAVGVLACRGLSHSRQATWQRRAVRGRKWFDAPLALLAYPWHVVRGCLGALVLLLAVGLATAGLVGVLVLAGTQPRDALLAGGAVLAVGAWSGPGAARVRDPAGRAATGVARHALVWWLVMVALGVLGGAWWWAGAQQGVHWAPASGAPWDALRELAGVAGI